MNKFYLEITTRKRIQKSFKFFLEFTRRELKKNYDILNY